MTANRRAVLGVATGGLLAACSPRASANPDVDFIIPYAPGGGFDSYVRAVMPALQQALHAQVIPQNVDGGGGVRAAQQLYRARPDGATISVVNIPGIMILQRQGGLNLDLSRLSWIANMGRDAYALMVSASSSIRTIDDLRALGRQRKVKFTCVSSAGMAYSATRIGARLLGISSEIITGYRGTNDYIVAAARGDGDACIASVASIATYMKANAVRVLCTFEKQSSLPGVPDATSLGLPELVDLAQFRAIAGPPGMAAATVTRLSVAFVKALQDPAVLDWAARNHANLTPDGALETRRILQDQARFITRWKDQLAAA
ncbi:MAG: tripartite tricarboxylate transporter substrate-binding protein [Caulobacteraceae bacterium]